jgi:probable F420-dependent oxidoreductase
MKVLTTLPQANLKDIASSVKQIEENGYDGVVTLENRHDPFLPLGIAAVNTSRLHLATGVAIAFPRSPMVMANTAWDLQHASNGRFELGIGTQVKGHNERRFSVPWTAPVPRLREYILSLQAIWESWMNGTKLHFQGDHYSFTLMTPNFTPEVNENILPPKISIAAVGPAMLRLAGATCAGVRLHPFCTPKYLQSAVMPEITVGLDKSQRQRSDFEITGGGFICTGKTDEDVEKMFEWVRYRIGFYGSTRAYWPVLEAHDLVDLGIELNRLSKTGAWGSMADCISDEVVNLFSAVGRHDQIADSIAEKFGGVSDALNASVSAEIPADLPPDVIQDIQSIPTSYVEDSKP